MATTPTKTLTDSLVELGFIAGVFGVRGEVRLHLHNRDTTLLDQPVEVHLVHQGESRTVVLSARSGSGGKVIGRIPGVSDRNAAEALKGAVFSVPESMLPELEDGEYYFSEIVGMQVFVGDEKVGEVVAVHSTGPVEVIELDGDRYLPSTADRILGIDRDARRLTIAEDALAV